MINPYKNVDWSKDQQVITTSHAHAKSQKSVDALYNGGVRFFTISNYYASEPCYPAVNNVISGIRSLREEIVVPHGCIVSANAEHHSMGIPALHMNSLGSLFSSGSPEFYNEEKSKWDRSSKPIGMNGKSYENMIDGSVRNLLYDDGGGITINHPVWTNRQNSEFKIWDLIRILDYSPYVLGQEVIEGGDYKRDARKWWDDVLKTGRRSWGFFVPDHKNAKDPKKWIGRNVLLVPEFTEHACLKAYRNGEFYGRKGWTDLSFTDFSVNDHVVSVSTNSAERIAFIEDGRRTEYRGKRAVYRCCALATYVRVEAEGLDDIIFSQPIIFRPYNRCGTRSAMTVM